MELILQPDDGVSPLIKAIDGATKSIEVAVFRLDRTDIQHALERAVARGVSVRALIAHTNRGGAKELRKLEMDFLSSGIEVARTANDLLRYHYKFMIVDRQILYMLAFNYTYMDIEKTRSFGIVTNNPDLVREAAKLFEADVKRRTYTPELETFLVSPINARHELSRFLDGAKEQLFIYDPEISDRRMIRLLRGRAKSGVEIRLIGRVKRSSLKIEPNGLKRARFHTRTIIRDRHAAFIGSQSLRETELDQRRELGLIVQDHHVVHTLLKVFESDWAALKPEDRKETAPRGGAIKRLSKAVVRDLPLEPLVERALQRALNDIRHGEFADDRLEHKLEDAMREALEDTVSQIVRETVEAETRA